MLEQYEDVLTIPEAAEVLHTGRNRIYALLHSGSLKGFQIGRIWKIPKQSVIEFILTNSQLK